jgi:hypothetical protein
MAAIIRETLTATQTTLTMNVAGMSKVGFNIGGNWTGTILFQGSFDGVNFASNPQGGPLNVTPFPPVGTGAQVPQSSTTVNGSFERDVQNYVAVRVTFNRVSGSAQVAIGASLDLSYQEAFLVSTSVFVNQQGGAGVANVLTIAAQPNRAWRCRTLVVSFSAVPAAPVLVTVSDGGSATLWQEYAISSSADASYKVKIPLDPPIPGTGSGGVFGTPGNSLVITCAAPGGAVVSQIDAEIMPA